MMIQHQEAEILAWEVSPKPNMKIGLGAYVYLEYKWDEPLPQDTKMEWASFM